MLNFDWVFATVNEQPERPLHLIMSKDKTDYCKVHTTPRPPLVTDHPMEICPTYITNSPLYPTLCRVNCSFSFRMSKICFLIMPIRKVTLERKQ